MVRRLGRSQQLLVAALAEQETVAVQAVVENHLGRRPTQSKLHAAQRSSASVGPARRRHDQPCRDPAHGMHPSRLAISRPRRWRDDWLDQDDDRGSTRGGALD